MHGSRISLRDDGRVDGVVYFDREGKEHFQRARAVIVSGYAIETPRLLLNSACPGHRHGLANSSGTVGRYLMAQAGNVVAGPIRRTGAHVQSSAGACAFRRVLRNRPEARFCSRICGSDRRSASDRLRQADDGGEGRMGMGHAARDDGLQPLGDDRSARRNPSLGGQSRGAGRGERPVRPARREGHIQSA